MLAMKRTTRASCHASQVMTRAPQHQALQAPKCTYALQAPAPQGTQGTSGTAGTLRSAHERPQPLPHVAGSRNPSIGYGTSGGCRGDQFCPMKSLASRSARRSGGPPRGPWLT